jgi:hypothetical protein
VHRDALEQLLEVRQVAQLRTAELRLRHLGRVILSQHTPSHRAFKKNQAVRAHHATYTQVEVA